jgi:hypothetical protein
VGQEAHMPLCCAPPLPLLSLPSLVVSSLCGSRAVRLAARVLRMVVAQSRTFPPAPRTNLTALTGHRPHAHRTGHAEGPVCPEGAFQRGAIG